MGAFSFVFGLLVLISTFVEYCCCVCKKLPKHCCRITTGVFLFIWFILHFATNLTNITIMSFNFPTQTGINRWELYFWSVSVLVLILPQFIIFLHVYHPCLAKRHPECC